jgi:RimJ/RimL family protein N-acetyltransferase
MAARILRAVRRRLWHRRELRILRCFASQIDALPRPTRLRRDHLDDLNAYRPTDADQMPRERYLEVARVRRGQGHHLYTFVEADRLAHYGWLIDGQERGEDEELGQVFFPPPRSSALYDYYTHPTVRGRGLYYDALCQVLHDARDLAGAEQAFIYIYSDNPGSLRVAEKAGFKHVGSLVLTRRFFLTRRFAVPAPGMEFRAGLLAGRKPSHF